MISRGAITKRANEEHFPAQTIERDYVLAQLCADIGAIGDARLVFKGGTLLRLCYFEPYRYSADLDFSAIDGLSIAEATTIVGDATAACRARIELPTLEVSAGEHETTRVTYVGPLSARARPRTLKLDISDSELVETHARIALYRRWADIPDDAGIEGYALDEVAAEKLRCVAERLECRDFYDLHELLDTSHVDALEAWELYLRKAANDVAHGRRRTPPAEWTAVFERRLDAYRDRWDQELGDYLAVVPAFGDVDRRSRRHLAAVLAAASRLAV